MTTIRIPNRVKIEELWRSLLTPGWQSMPQSTQVLGETFLTRTSVLCVPSAIIPEESNYVINPAHTDFRRIEFSEPVPFHFDSRLKSFNR